MRIRQKARFTMLSIYKRRPNVIILLHFMLLSLLVQLHLLTFLSKRRHIQSYLNRKVEENFQKVINNYMAENDRSPFHHTTDQTSILSNEEELPARDCS